MVKLRVPGPDVKRAATGPRRRLGGRPKHRAEAVTSGGRHFLMNLIDPENVLRPSKRNKRSWPDGGCHSPQLLATLSHRHRQHGGPDNRQRQQLTPHITHAGAAQHYAASKRDEMQQRIHLRD